MSIKGFIYIIANDLNNKVYVGQTINSLKYRFNQHARTPLEKCPEGSIDYDIQTLGPEHFFIELLEECDRSELNAKERKWISFFNAVHEGYNLKNGGQGPGAYSLNDEEIKSLIKDYHLGMTNKEIEEKYHIVHSTMYRLFRANQVGLRGANSEACHQSRVDNFKKATLSRQVKIHNKTLDIYYSSKKEALEAMIEQGYSNATDWHNIRAPLDKSLKNSTKRFLGFEWEIVEKEN